MLFLLIILIVMPAYLYYGYMNRPVNAPWATVGDIQIRATSVQVIGFALGGPAMSLTAVVYNPNGFGVSLNGANYSTYANDHYLQSGQIDRRYALAAQSSQTFVLPFSIDWKLAFQTLGDYLWAGGSVKWEVKGIATIEVGGLLLRVPFDLSTHTS